jgi:hypothetical protein
MKKIDQNKEFLFDFMQHFNPFFQKSGTQHFGEPGSG